MILIPVSPSVLNQIKYKNQRSTNLAIILFFKWNFDWCNAILTKKNGIFCHVFFLLKKYLQLCRRHLIGKNAFPVTDFQTFIHAIFYAEPANFYRALYVKTDDAKSFKQIKKCKENWNKNLNVEMFFIISSILELMNLFHIQKE